MTDDAHDSSPPSRSQQRRQALQILKLSEQLAALSPAQLAHLPINAALREQIAQTSLIRTHIARKRELAFLAKQLRRHPPEEIEAIIQALEVNGTVAHQQTAALHRVEAWRERLLAEGDRALEALLETYPHADAQHLRQLLRNARLQHARNKLPRAFRELFQVLRRLDASALNDTQAVTTRNPAL